jgi:hypothetical protein
MMIVISCSCMFLGGFSVLNNWRSHCNFGEIVSISFPEQHHMIIYIRNVDVAREYM